MIFKLILLINTLLTSYEIAISWMPRAHWYYVKIGSGNDLVPSGDKYTPYGVMELC